MDRCIANNIEKVSSKNERLTKQTPWQYSQNTYAVEFLLDVAIYREVKVIRLLRTTTFRDAIYF